MIEFLSAGFDELLVYIEAIEPIYIYLILFAIAFTENIFPPIPGDTFTIIGGYLAATGQLNLATTFIAITFGTIASVMLIYMLGYRGGREYFEKKNYKFFNVSDMAAVNNLFDKYGSLILLVSRFIIGMRVLIAISAGISKFSPTRTIMFSYLSGALFHGILIALAYLLHTYIDNLVDYFNIYSKIVIVIVAGILIMWLVVIIKRMRNAKRKA